jgi:hypothetical protein
MIAIRIIDQFLVKAAIQIIRLYQKSLSPDHGLLKKRFSSGYCRFQPTCSEYSITALQKYGFLKGGLLSIGRILRCHPWSRGGWDPLR